MSEEAKCDCQHCGGHIAFPSEAAGQAVECPHCKNETVLSLPPTEPNADLEIFINVKDEQRGPFAKSQVLSMWNNGLITSDADYWHEGMSDWLPISALIKEVSASLPTPPPTPPAPNPLASAPIASGVNVANLMELAKAAAEANNPKEAYNYYTKVLEYLPRNPDAWIGKGEAAGWMSTLRDVKTVEMVAAFNNAINYAEEPAKEGIRIHAAEVINRVNSTCFGMAKKHLLQFAKVNTVWPEYVQQCRLLLSALEVGHLYDPNNKTTIENIIHISKDNIQGHSHSQDAFGLLSIKLSVTPQYKALLRAKIDEYTVKMYRLDPNFVKPRV